MSYKALYRLYRPQSFEEVAGQKYILKTLQNQIKENKISHAYLFSGPRGTGKTTMAKLLAKAVNCVADNKPCNECDSCKAVTLGTHPDVIEIDAASNNGVDEVRDLIERTKFAPTLGKYKVYIIDEVHMMTPGAFNALLKTLEEPPAHVIFVLATTEVNKIIPTILSRCQRFDFGKVSKKDIENRLKEILKAEEKTCDEESISMIADLADGGMRDALSILDQTIAYATDHITVNHVKDIYGMLSKQEKVELLINISEKNTNEMLSKVEQYDASGIDVSRVTLNIIDVLKDALVYSKTRKENLLQTIEEIDALNLLNKLSENQITNIIDILVETLGNYKRVANAKSLFELALLKAINLVDIKTNFDQHANRTIVEKEIYQEKEEKSNNEKREKSVNSVKNAVERDEPTSDEIINVMVQASKEAAEKIKKNWPLINGYVGNPKYGSVVGLLADCTPKACCDNGIILVSDTIADTQILQMIKNKRLLQDFFESLYGEEIEFYAITKDQFDEYRTKYLKLRQASKLPQPKIIKKKKYQTIEANVEDNQAVDYGKNIFGDLLQIEEE